MHGSEVGMSEIIYWIVMGFLAAFWLCGVICIFSEGEFMGKVFHKLLGWHWPDLDKPVRIDGILISAHCKFCGKEIQMDSQGNWYTYE